MNAGIPKQSAAMAAVLGATGGFMLAYQSSSGASISEWNDSALLHAVGSEH